MILSIFTELYKMALLGHQIIFSAPKSFPLFKCIFLNVTLLFLFPISAKEEYFSNHFKYSHIVYFKDMPNSDVGYGTQYFTCTSVWIVMSTEWTHSDCNTKQENRNTSQEKAHSVVLPSV